MTKRSMTHFNKQLQAAYRKGWADSFAKTVMDAQTIGIALKDGTGKGRLVITRGREAVAEDFVYVEAIDTPLVEQTAESLEVEV